MQPQGMKFIDETAGVFRAGELFSIPYQAKAIVDALFEDTAQAGFPLDEKNLSAVLVGSNGRGQPGRPPPMTRTSTVSMLSPSFVIWFCHR